MRTLGPLGTPRSNCAIRRLSDAVVSRAINGVAVPVFFQGEQIGERRHYDEQLAMVLLRYRDPLRHGKWLDKREQRGGRGRTSPPMKV